MKPENFIEAKTHKEFVDKIINTFKKNKLNMKELQPINIYEFIGIFATAVSQMELQIWNSFLIKHNVYEKESESLSSAHSNSFSGGYRVSSDGNYIVFDNKSLNINKLCNAIKCKMAETRKKLRNGRWNSLINNIVEIDNEYSWFKEIRNYRHELIHDVDNYNEVFSSLGTMNMFKTAKTIIDFEKF